MCGDDPRESIGGALAVLRPFPSMAEDSIRTSLLPLCGRLVFHDRYGRTGGSVATHAIYMPESPLYSEKMAMPCLARIHETGDLTLPAAESPPWAILSLKPVNEAAMGNLVVYELSRPVKMGVGADGIIGRRVSIWARQDTGPVAEGIAGFN